MQNYPEAREALELVFESGTPQQKQHAKRMLQQIEAAEAGV
jgi:FimV-like protein